MQYSRKLKNYLIYPQFQWKLIFLFMGVSLVAPVLLLTFQLFLFHRQLNDAYVASLPDSHPYLVFLNLFQEQSILVFMIALSISFVISFVLGVLISHRVAGPLVKLKKHFENVGQDSLNDTTVQFRNNDFFKEVAAAYNLRFEKK